MYVLTEEIPYTGQTNIAATYVVLMPSAGYKGV